MTILYKEHLGYIRMGDTKKVKLRFFSLTGGMTSGWLQPRVEKLSFTLMLDVWRVHVQQ